MAESSTNLVDRSLPRVVEEKEGRSVDCTEKDEKVIIFGTVAKVAKVSAVSGEKKIGSVLPQSLNQLLAKFDSS